MKHGRTMVTIIAAGLMLALLVWQGSSLAAGGVGNIGGGLGGGGNTGETQDPSVQQPGGAQPAEPPDDPTEDGDTEGHETENPTKPDHASGSIADVTLAGEPLAEVGSNNAAINDDGTASGDVVVLALLGEEVIGGHSECPAVDCEGGTASGGVAPGLLCEETAGGVCVGLLFAETTSSVTNEESSATADQALAFACVGGTQEAPEENCDGFVGAGVSENHSSITQDNTNGNTTSDQATDVADVCVGPTGEDPLTGTCSGIGASALHSESHSEANSETGPGTTERSSYLLALELAGEQAITISDPIAIEVPPGCPAGGSLLCVYLNQGESFVYTGGGASRQEALHIAVLAGAIDGADLVGGHVSDAETLAENTGPACPPGATRADCVPLCPSGVEVMPDGTCPVQQPPGLPVTGMDTAIPLAVALTLMLMGAWLVAWDRRREMAIA
jgi:hypothetical protein